MNCYGPVLRRDAASRLTSAEKLRMVSFTCSTSVELFPSVHGVDGDDGKQRRGGDFEPLVDDPLHGSLGSFARVLAGRRSIDPQEAALG